MQNAVISAIYGLNGELLGEYRQDGSAVNEYIYLNGQPLALLNQGQVYTLHNDHLGTPQVMSNALGQKVWQAHYDPFGNATVNEDVDGDGQTISLNLRFPGQYYDQESGLHYNYFRYYDPSTGRYITSDPIGLAGGLNTYLYANATPLKYIDPKGLDASIYPKDPKTADPSDTTDGYIPPSGPSVSDVSSMIETAASTCEGRCNFLAGSVCGIAATSSGGSGGAVFLVCRAQIYAACAVACPDEPDCDSE